MAIRFRPRISRQKLRATFPQGWRVLSGVSAQKPFPRPGKKNGGAGVRPRRARQQQGPFSGPVVHAAAGGQELHAVGLQAVPAEEEEQALLGAVSVAAAAAAADESVAASEHQEGAVGQAEGELLGGSWAERKGRGLLAPEEPLPRPSGFPSLALPPLTWPGGSGHQEAEGRGAQEASVGGSQEDLPVKPERLEVLSAGAPQLHGPPVGAKLQEEGGGGRRGLLGAGVDLAVFGEEKEEEAAAGQRAAPAPSPGSLPPCLPWGLASEDGQEASVAGGEADGGRAAPEQEPLLAVARLLSRAEQPPGPLRVEEAALAVAPSRPRAPPPASPRRPGSGARPSPAGSRRLGVRGPAGGGRRSGVRGGCGRRPRRGPAPGPRGRSAGAAGGRGRRAGGRPAAASRAARRRGAAARRRRRPRRPTPGTSRRPRPGLRRPPPPSPAGSRRRWPGPPAGTAPAPPPPPPRSSAPPRPPRPPASGPEAPAETPPSTDPPPPPPPPSPGARSKGAKAGRRQKTGLSPGGSPPPPASSCLQRKELGTCLGPRELPSTETPSPKHSAVRKPPVQLKSPTSILSASAAAAAGDPAGRQGSGARAARLLCDAAPREGARPLGSSFGLHGGCCPEAQPFLPSSAGGPSRGLCPKRGPSSRCCSGGREGGREEEAQQGSAEGWPPACLPPVGSSGDDGPCAASLPGAHPEVGAARGSRASESRLSVRAPPSAFCACAVVWACAEAPQPRRKEEEEGGGARLLCRGALGLEGGPSLAMEKLGASLGVGGPSRKELLEALEAQRAQLAQYQARLKDLVRAYKGLLQEKGALEASLQALSGRGAGGPPGGPSGGEPEEEEEAGGGCGAAEPEPDPERRLLRLKGRLSTLAAALATVSQEKSRAEASFQADKRRLRQEMEEERQRLQREAQEAREQLAQTKARLLAQQQDRAQEQSHHALMLQELQRLLQDERALRQEAEGALAGEASHAERAQEAERLARRLGRQVEGLEGQLRALRQESGRPEEPQVQGWQDQADALRSHFQAQLLQEMRKTAHAEERISMEEQRAANLEAQISEASELLGSYEKAKQRDQAAIQRLRERLAQMDLENKTLALAASGRCPLPDVGLEESSLDVNVLKDRMEKLRGLLRAATKQDLGEREGEASPHKSEVPDAPKEEEEEEAADGEKVSVAYYQRELKRLKEEFEHYKQEQQQQKNRPVAVAQDGSSGGRELAEAQAQLVALRENYVSLRLSHEELVQRHQEEAEGWRQEAAQIQQRHREELERARRDSREEALQLEEEVRRQRERALAVLAEKDQELDRLRALAWPYTGLPPGPKPPLPPPLAPGPLPPTASPGPEGSLEGLTQALRLSGPGEPPFLLYTEQLARRSVELSALRQEKRRLEGELRRLRESLLAVEEKHREEVGALRSCLQKSTRDQGREGANLEYLKNVFFRFLTLADGLGRQQTLGAILTVLHFSPEEREAVLSQAGGSGAHSWWPSGKR
ncbi:GRIP and coiled-coil domain-containing protein 1 [Sceloporus undulatus]|uniref:GRIP and coiled-coil domain-containing protein 1 n=1 Tax=Sceloporus undulatus TaxID=8520 RepID=UPI001C4D9701|nr:GRIP and coiled-coil domain-containing protein 1 [Sceloporus undulatus]